MVRDRLILALILACSVGVLFADLVLIPDTLLPSAPYALPIVLAAALLPPASVAGVACFTVLLEVVAAGLQQVAPTWLSALYVVSLMFVGVLGTMVSAKIRSEVALGREKDRLAASLRVLVDNLPTGVLFSDLDGSITIVNPTAKTILGGEMMAHAANPDGSYTLHLPDGSPFAPDDLPLVRVLDSWEPVRDVEIVVKWRDGRERTILTSAVPIADEAGNRVGAAATIEDITERRRAEETRLQLVREQVARAESEATVRRLRLLQSVSDAGVDQSNLDDLLVRLLDGLREWLGGDTGALLLLSDDGQALETRATTGLEEEVGEKVRIPLGRGFSGRVAEGRRPVVVDDTSEIEVWSPTLRERIKSILGVPLTTKDRVIGTIYIGATSLGKFELSDLPALELVAERAALIIENSRLYQETLTERERWRATVESMLDLVTICDAQGRATYMNSSYARLMGISIQEGLSLESHPAHYQLYHPDGILFLAEELPLQRAALRNEEVRDVTLVERTSGGEDRVTIWNASPMHDAAGRVLGAVAVGRDVTELRRLERNREEYLALISHDLRAPLSVITGNAQLMKRLADDPDRVRKIAAVIHASARRMNAMISDLVESTRLELGQVDLEREPVDPKSCLVELKDRLASALEADRIRIDMPDAGLPPVSADPAKLERILTNLLSNGLKYSEAEVVVRAERVGEELKIAVVDRGRGIDPEELPLLFGRFYRAGSAAGKEGLGLGLYITRLLVEAHGGRIWVESAQGEGSSFYFTLPCWTE